MKRHIPKSGFTITELLVVVAAVSICTSLMLPTLANSRGDSMLQESMSNLMTLSVAHVMYAADFNGRQVTYTVDDLSAYGDSVDDYHNASGCGNDPWGDPWNPGCIPPIIAGWGESQNQNVAIFAYWPGWPTYHWSVIPLTFPGGSEGVDGFGNFRLGNSKRLHDYVNGRFYDATFYAPKDTLAMEVVKGAFDNPFEYDTALNPPTWISYVPSPAAMYHPNVMRANSSGGWLDPWSIDNGFESPGLFQAIFPSLKTQIIEHNWLQNPPADCNPAGSCILYEVECAPYKFNQGIDSSPATLFYDGHVRLLPNTEVYAADQQVFKATGGVDGLWHRGTPFGIDGYCIPNGFDGVPLSHHILTTSGIYGRDTLADISPLSGESSYFDSPGWAKSKASPSDYAGPNTTRGETTDKPIWSIEFLPDLP